MDIRKVDRRVLIAGAAVALLVIALVVVLAVTRGGTPEATTEPTTVIYRPDAPTPETEPVERDTSTDLLAALPGTVLGWAVSGQEGSSGMSERFALEGWRLTYTGAPGDVVVQVGQWPDDGEAQAAWESVVGSADGEELHRGEVQVDDETTGEVVVIATPDGERAIWRNGTVVIVADTPADEALRFYEAYAL